MTGLRLGAAVADITPDLPISLAGYASRAGTKADKVAHPLRLRAAVVETDGDRAVVVGSDLLGWSPDLVGRVTPGIARAAGAPEDAVLLTATHTHSGPATGDCLAPSAGVPDRGYLDRLAHLAVDAAARAADRLGPVTVARARADHALAVYRRTPWQGAIVNRPNVGGPRDTELTALAFRRPDGTLAAAALNYACHPVINHTNAVSGDFTGVAAATLEDDLGVPVLYLQGCCGDQNPGGSAGAGLGEVEVQGRRLAEAARSLIAAATAALPSAPVAVRRAEASLPFKRAITKADVEAHRGDEGVMGEWAAGLVDRPERIRPDVILRLVRVDLAEGLGLLGINAEPTVAYGLAIKRESGGSVLPVGYAGGVFGYLPTAEQIAAGGYEAVESARYYLLADLLAPQAEERALEAIRGLL